MTQWREEDGTSRSCSSDELMGILRTLDPVDSTSGSRNKSAAASSMNLSVSAAGHNISSTNDPPHSATSEVVNSTNNHTEALTSATSVEESNDNNDACPPCTSSSCEPSSSCSSTTTTAAAVIESRVTTTTPDNNGVSESGCKEDTDPSTNFVASSNFNRGSQRDKYANPIPLPAPPSCSNDLTVTSACGGNQSYIGYGLSNSTFQRLQDRPCSPTFGNTRPTGHVFSTSPYITARPPGVVGLDNLGNTCFMNSGLQCLISTPRIVQYFLSGDINLSNICTREKALVTEFQSLIKCAWWGTATKVSPRDFKDVLGNVLAQFNDGRQHDCQEFLVATLDVLHEQLKLWNKQVNECGSSTITTSGRSDSSSGVYSGWASDTDISSSQTSPGETNLEASASSPQTKRRRLDVLESEESHSEPKCSTSEEFKGVLSEDSGTETIRLSDANLDVEEEEAVLGLDINHENDDLPESEVDGNNEVDSTTNLLKKADDFWNNYLLENNTVVANSFQGMYKSTVKCSTCEYVSITYEPFMYLPLPIPRVVERKFDVTFSMQAASAHCKPKKVTVTVGVEETVGKLKEQVIGSVIDESVWGNPLSTYVVAEVVNNSICRLLNDETPLRNVYDGNRNIYVFELNQDFDDLGSGVYGSSMDDCNSNKATYSYEYQPELRPMTYLEEDWEIADSPSQIVQGPLPNPANYLEQQSSVNYEHQTSAEVPDTQEVDIDLRVTENIGDDPVNATMQEGGPADQCCSVCLEDFPKPSLRQHYGCSCLLCVDCMTKTATHYDPPSVNEGKGDAETSAKKSDKRTLLKCPVCSEILNYEQTFLPLGDNNDGDGAPQKLNQIPLLFRHELESDSNNNAPPNSKLFFFPWLVKLPSSIPAVELYTFINRINPFPDHNFKLVNLSWNGKQCNTCMYTMSCRGCEIPMDGVISISPKSSIAISYTNLPPDFVENVEPPDMAKCNREYFVAGVAKEDPNVDIYECLSAFSEIEHLDATWNCPRCKVNREATKALSICKVPDYLIVYLKRFVFMDQMSSKLNTRLIFPLNDLDLKSFIAEEFRGTDEIKGDDNIMFDLYACVCHFGSSSAGHYTAYAKNPESNQWNYFNDQSVSLKTPSDDEFTSAYVLFYARKGYKCDIPQRHMIPTCVQTPNLCNKSDSTSPSEESGTKDTFNSRSPPSDSILCDSTSVMDQDESSALKLIDRYTN